MVLDDFDRDYYLNLGNSFTVKDNRKYLVAIKIHKHGKLIFLTELSILTTCKIDQVSLQKQVQEGNVKKLLYMHTNGKRKNKQEVR